MLDKSSYWTRRTVSRRTALRGLALAGATALTLVGCGGGSTKETQKDVKGGPTGEVLDPTKGKPGGKFLRQYQTVSPSLNLVATMGNPATLGGFTHSGLLTFRHGHPGVDPYDISVEADLAQALPEQPDELTYTFKLKDARFQNGRAVTAEDVKYSFDRWAFSDQSAFKTLWTWYEKTETPDAKTVIVKTKAPFADGLSSLAARTDAFVLAKEHEESPEVDRRLMGSGPFIFVDSNPPVVARFRKNPDYFLKPYPYFDEVELLGSSDPSKRMADYVTGQTHLTYRFSEEERDQIKKSRADALNWLFDFSAFHIFLRGDKPPFNDKRVRQALSMALDRKAIREGTSKGEGEPDQVLSWTSKVWGFRKPGELGAAAKYWNYDPQTAKQLLSAAGVTLPIESTMTHNDVTFLGPSFVDSATLAQAQWRALGIANVKDVGVSPTQGASTISIGNYEGMWQGPNALANSPAFGVRMRSEFFAPPDGIRAPTLNTTYTVNPQLNPLVEKQLSQMKLEERKQTLRQIEEILAEEQYRIPYSSVTNSYFSDPGMRNVQVPKYVFAGGTGFVKYWWFDKS